MGKRVFGARKEKARLKRRAESISGGDMEETR
jgi:hypothetical protein